MKITNLRIQNFKSIHDMHIPDIENALILVGQNNTGKTTVLDAIRAVGGEYVIKPEDFGEAGAKMYYTWDDTVPTANSMEYTKPIPVPEGNNILSVVLIDRHGMVSDILKCNYKYLP